MSKADPKGAMPTGEGIDGPPELITTDRFKGQNVLITGAAQGIGQAVAHRIAHENGSLFLVDRSELVHEVAAELAEEIDAHHQAEQYLQNGQQLCHVCPPSVAGATEPPPHPSADILPVFWENM